ncbi:MAG: chitobiase/beta-hexosaminidase C-terminal domain-containing protein [Bacteroidales bacterium]|nr:chitobiase/beta-hexosaminidase C-terminal domain-containing protein [Bacteroidales bacterium]
MQMKTSPLSCKVLTISRLDASAISGDTYACAMPLEINQTDSPATKVEIAVVGANGTYTFAKEVSGLARGTIYDLGSLPTACIAPKISIDTAGRAVMTAAPAEAAIYYTTDGSDPSSASTLYEGPVEITGAVTIKAIAVCSGLGNSGITSLNPAADAVAPVLSINATGSLVVAAEDGHSYKYSISTTGAPGEPDTAFPAEGIDLKSTGSHYIRVEADFSGKTATTNALYRVYYLSSGLPTGTKVELNASNPVDNATFAPFTATRFASSANEDKTCTLARGTNGLYWKTIVSSPSAYTIFIGLETRYASDLSLHTFCRGTTNVYPRYCGIRSATTEDGVEVPGSISSGIKQTNWSAWWSIKASAGKMIEFAVPNERELRGWGVLEQGFAAFGPAQASVSTEKPGIGKIVNY